VARTCGRACASRGGRPKSRFTKDLGRRARRVEIESQSQYHAKIKWQPQYIVLGCHILLLLERSILSQFIDEFYHIRANSILLYYTTIYSK